MGMAWTVLSSQSTPPDAKMSLHTDVEGEYLAGPDCPASTYYPCEAPGLVLLESCH